MKTLLLTWWTGYIWSHCAVSALEAGYEVIILDNLSNSKESITDKIGEISWKKVIFYRWDITEPADIERVFRENSIDAVLHFAGLKAVGESCVKPFEYYENNVIGTKNLCEVMEKYSCKNIIFSSSATVYNPFETPPFSETTPTGWTTNPYGTTKFIVENLLRDLANHKWFNVINLRYFNPIGAHSSWLIGEDPNDIPNNLLPYIMKVAAGELEALSVFWDDYDTPDGTWLRDYIHVVDLAEGHIAALQYLRDQQHVYEEINLWTGKATSVLEMLEYAREASWREIPCSIVERRPGDIAAAYCSPDKAKQLLWWEASISVKDGVNDSWNFIQKQKKK